MTDPVVDTVVLGRVLSGTGGIWRVRRSDGEVIDAALRGRLKRHDDAKAKLARSDRDGGRTKASVRSRGERRDERAADTEGPALKLAVGDEVQIEQESEGASWRSPASCLVAHSWHDARPAVATVSESSPRMWIRSWWSSPLPILSHIPA